MQDKTFINLLSEVIDQATANLVENDWVLSEKKKELTNLVEYTQMD